ncbi:MAG: hypothetical protein ACYCOU_00405 [Sulfobacillus sp.]
MANYVAMARTNYFKVKDVEAFEKFVETLDDAETITDEVDGETLYGIIFDEQGIPSSRQYVNDIGEEVEEEDIDFPALLAEHLVDGWVAELREVGFEKTRYLIGLAILVNSKGQRWEVHLEQIHEKIKDLGEHHTDCAY